MASHPGAVAVGPISSNEEERLVRLDARLGAPRYGGDRGRRRASWSWSYVRMRVVRLALAGLLALVGFITVYPLFFTGINALKSETAFARDPLGLPLHPTLSNFGQAARELDLGRLILNSVITTGGGVIVTTFAALLAAYAVAKLHFPGRSLLFLLIIGTLAIPVQAIIYPLYDVLLRTQLVGSYPGLILGYAAFGLPLGTFFLAAHFRSIPEELIEAARVDGAGHIRIVFRVLAPASVPPLAALSILNLVWMWNDLILPLVTMGGGPNKTLMVGVSLLMGQYNVSIPLISAGLIVALLPILLVYLVFQRQLIRGVLAGAVK